MSKEKENSLTAGTVSEENIVYESVHPVSEKEWNDMLQDIPEGNINAQPDEIK